MLTKFAKVEEILEVKSLDQRMAYSLGEEAGDRLVRFAAASDMKTEDGYLYVRCRAISSRVNKNNDGWPAEELAKSFKTFIGKPIFVDHNNDDPKRTRGVIVDAQLHVEDPEKASAFDPYYATAPDNHKPPTWIELLMEIDGETYPKLAEAIKEGKMDSVSMGANIEKSICSVCANEAATPTEYCSHIKQKGVTFEITSDNGDKVKKKSYEDCYGIGFFEISNVFDPADETADSWLDEQKAARLAARATQEGVNPDELLAYVGMKNDGVLAKAASTGRPLMKELVERLADFEDEHLAPSLHEGLSYPDDPNGQDQVIAIMRQIIEAHQNGDVDGEAHLKQQLSAMLGPHQAAIQIEAALTMYADGLGLSDYGQSYRQERTPGYYDKACPRCGAQLREATNDAAGVAYFCDKCGWHGPDPQQGSAPMLSSIKFTHPAEQFVKPVDQKGQTGERNYEPQSEMTTAPQHVDTLRSETRCPICRAADMETDPDGIMRCPTCGHVQEPEPMNDPDLSMARDVDLRQDSTDAKNPEGEPEAPASNPLDAVEFSPMETPAPVAATKNSYTNEEISEMFKLKLRTSNKEEAVAAMQGTVKVATAELKLGANGIHRGIYDAAKEAGLKVKVSYPAVDDEENFVEIPGENGVFNLFFAQESAVKLKVPVAEVPIVIEASTQSDLDKFTEILANTARPEKNSRQAAEKKPILQSDAKPSDEPRDATVVKDEHAPRETKTVTVTEDVVEMDGKQFRLVEVSDDEDKDEPKGESEEKSDSADDKSEEIDTSKAEDLASEVAEEDDKESKLLAAFKVADMAVDLGLVSVDNKMAFIAELEEDSMDQLSAREATMKSVKTAGLSKSTKRISGIKRVPRLSHSVIANNGGTTNDTPDEALFL